MLEFHYEVFYPLLPLVWLFFLNWFFFFRTNFYTIRIKTVKLDKLNKNNPNKKFHFSNIIYCGVLHISCLYLYFFLLRGVSGLFFWNHLNINNLIQKIILLVLMFNILFLIIILFLRFSRLNYHTDYIFALLNLNNFLPLLFLSNNLFTMFFVLEVNSTIIFYKFIMSKIWYNRDKNNQKSDRDLLNKNIMKNYINILFFQYWTTFFSSTLFLFTLINIIYMYGSTDFFFLNFIEYSLSLRGYYLNYFYKTVLILILLLSVLLKIGFTPLQLFKIEIYKGIPFISIFFYTTFYFLVYYLLFSLLLVVYLFILNYQIYYCLIIFTIIGGIFVIGLFFDVLAIKAFFAYSSLINSILFLNLLLSGTVN